VVKIAGLVDGMGFEEVNQEVTSTAVISGTDVYGTGSVHSPNGLFTTMSGTNIYAQTKVQSDILQSDATISGVTARVSNDLTVGSSINMGLTASEGIVVTNVAAEAIITGGMWVMVSGASGATPSYVAKPAPAHTTQPAGICLATVASGATASIITRGAYNGIIAEDTVDVGAGVSMGSGAKLNTALPDVGGAIRGTCIMGGGSEAVIGIYLF